MEVQVRKLKCVSKAIPTLPINIEDAARSEVEIEAAEKVEFHCFYVTAYHKNMFRSIDFFSSNLVWHD